MVTCVNRYALWLEVGSVQASVFQAYSTVITYSMLIEFVALFVLFMHMVLSQSKSDTTFL